MQTMFFDIKVEISVFQVPRVNSTLNIVALILILVASKLASPSSGTR